MPIDPSPPATPRSVPPTWAEGPIRSFRDALGAALGLAADRDRAMAAVILDRAGRAVAETVVTDAETSSIEAILAWAVDRGGWRRPDRSVLVVSVRPVDPARIHEVDLGRFRLARWTLARAGLGLLDWIETDGDLARSYAHLAAPAEAWPDDPPDHRAQDRLNERDLGR